MLLAASAVLVLLVLAALLVAMPAIYGWGIYARFREKRTVVCPETQSGATVQADAVDASVEALHGNPRLRLRACSRWPARRGCGQECVVQILNEPVGEARGFHILPVLLGALAVWALLGALGYSPLVRGWIVRLGVPAETVQQGYELVLPALLPLVVAIGLGFILQLALQHRHYTLLGGAGVGAVVGLAISAVALPLVPRAGETLLWVYVVFAVLACALMGAFFTAWETVASRQ